MALDLTTQRILGEAYRLYAAGSLRVAQEKTTELLNYNSSTFQAWDLLAQILDEQGKSVESINTAVIAANTYRSDPERWFNVARRSHAIGAIDQALLCYNRAVSTSNGNMEILLEQTELLAEVGRSRKALAGFKTLLRQCPMNLSIIRAMAKLYNENAEPEHGIILYDDVFAHQLLHFEDISADEACGWSELNIVAELCLRAKNYTGAIEKIHRFGEWLNRNKNATKRKGYEDFRRNEQRTKANRAFK